jgi:hypothetical protein
MLVYILALWNVFMVHRGFVTKNIYKYHLCLASDLTPSWYVAVDIFSIVMIVINDKVIYSVNNSTYTVTNTQLATCFCYSKQASGQYLIYEHGAFSECMQAPCPYIKYWPEDCLLEPKHVANCVLVTVYVLLLTK